MTPRDAGLEAMELRIAKFLRSGVLVAGALMLVGGVLEFKGWGGDPFAAYRDFDPLPLVDRLSAEWAAGEWGPLVAYAGLCVLISLPVLRVLTTAILFVKQKEFVLAGIATAVLVALAVSFSLGFTPH